MLGLNLAVDYTDKVEIMDNEDKNCIDKAILITSGIVLDDGKKMKNTKDFNVLGYELRVTVEVVGVPIVDDFSTWLDELEEAK